MAKKMSTEELFEKSKALGAGELILDVRSEDEFREGHIQGSRNIPHDQIQAIFAAVQGYRKVYVHCRSGARATRAVQALEGMGLTQLVCVSCGGMEEWVKSGYPVVT